MRTKLGNTKSITRLPKQVSIPLSAINSFSKSNHEKQSEKQITSSKQIVRCLAVVTLILFAFTYVLADKLAKNRAAVFDFDGDGKTDFTVVRSEIVLPNLSVWRWYILRSSDGVWYAPQWGIDSPTSDRYVPEDYDGDGKWDVAIYRCTESANFQCYFYILQSSTNSLKVIQWGLLTDYKLNTQDFDGDGKADPTAIRATDNDPYVWYILLSRTNEAKIIQFGTGACDKTIRGDFDGDGKADIALYRGGRAGCTPANTFIILRSSDNQIQTVQFGNSEFERVIPGDFDGDGKTDFALYRQFGHVSQRWRWIQSSNGGVRTKLLKFIENPNIYDNTGIAPGDYDGDGKTDVAASKAPIGIGPTYFTVMKSTGGILRQQWGNSDVENYPMHILQAR